MRVCCRLLCFPGAGGGGGGVVLAPGPGLEVGPSHMHPTAGLPGVLLGALSVHAFAPGPEESLIPFWERNTGTALSGNPHPRGGPPWCFCLPPSAPDGLKLAFLQFVDKSGFASFLS